MQQFYFWILLVTCLAELALFIFIWRFFLRLRRSEEYLDELQEGQDRLLAKIEINATLEKELVESFAQRQEELAQLNMRLEERADSLRKLLDQAEAVSRSPKFLRELIISGSRKGRSPEQLSKSTGLSLDEVELILAQSDI